MFKIALIQNQLEMAHYSYADTRLFIDTFKNKYRIDSVELFTAHNIKQLVETMNNSHFDAIIVSSQAINDAIIRETIYSEVFKKELDIFLSRGRGLLVFHQHRLAKNALEGKNEKGVLSFLPERLHVPSAYKTDPDSYKKGNLILTDVGEKSYIMNCPNRIDVTKVKEKCLNNNSISGIYWHCWNDINEGSWDVLIEDNIKGNDFPLVVSSKESTNARVVLSSLTLDWQEQTELFENILAYVLKGTSQIAVVHLEETENINFQYLLDQLRFNKKTPYISYYLRDEKALNEFERTIVNGFHSIILLTEQSKQSLDQSFITIINDKIEKGLLKMIVIGKDNFNVFGRERDELRIFYNLEIIVRGQIPIGYVDSSYLSTVDSLRSLSRIPESKPITKKELQNVLDRIITHTKDGSYDGVFGATCPLLWLESRYFGKPKESEYTKKTLDWLLSNKDRYGFEEKAQLFNTMLDEEIFTSKYNKKSIEQELKGIIDNLDDDYGSIKEMEMVHLLHSLNYFNDLERIVKAVHSLETKRTKGIWIDVGITASLVIELIDSRKLFLNYTGDSQDLFIKYQETARRINKMIFIATSAIGKDKIAIENSNRPWGNNISINLLCIEALLKFDALIEMPISEIIDSVYTYSKMETHKDNLETSLDVLSSVSSELTEEKREHEELKKNCASQKEELETVSKSFGIARIIAWISSVTVLVMIYLYVIFILYVTSITVNPEETNFGKFFIGQIGTHIGFIFGLVGLVFTLLGLTKAKKKKKQKDE